MSDQELRTGQMAKRLGIDRKTVIRWIEDNNIPHRRTPETPKKKGEVRVLESVFVANAKKHGLKDSGRDS